MKTRFLMIVALFVFGLSSLFAQSKTEKFKVYGNCGMCESRIEKAVTEIDGVTAADWNKDTKMIEVSFDSAKTNIHVVHMSIAKVGHDTDMHRASDEVYNALPACCQYERPEKMAKMPSKSHKQ